jgi:arabinan endo-1,5-alpha-L-arabinosidase
VEKGWPEGEIGVRIGDFMNRPHQKWRITPVPDAGGYFGSPYYRITIEGTNRTLAATADYEVVTVPEFTGAPEQLWQIDQLTDGTYRIMPRVVPGSGEQPALTAVGRSTPTLARFDSGSYNARWTFKIQ